MVPRVPCRFTCFMIRHHVTPYEQILSVDTTRARPASMAYCHCEERSDVAISQGSNGGWGRDEFYLDEQDGRDEQDFWCYGWRECRVVRQARDERRFLAMTAGRFGLTKRVRVRAGPFGFPHVIASAAWQSRRRSNDGSPARAQPQRDCHVAALLAMTTERPRA